MAAGGAGAVEVETPYGRVRLSQRRRRWRFATGGARVEFGHVRATQVESARGDVLEIPRASDPLVNAALGALILWAASAVILSIARWLSEHRDGTSRAVARH